MSANGNIRASALSSAYDGKSIKDGKTSIRHMTKVSAPTREYEASPVAKALGFGAPKAPAPTPAPTPDPAPPRSSPSYKAYQKKRLTTLIEDEGIAGSSLLGAGLLAWMTKTAMNEKPGEQVARIRKVVDSMRENLGDPAYKELSGQADAQSALADSSGLLTDVGHPIVAPVGNGVVVELNTLGDKTVARVLSNPDNWKISGSEEIDGVTYITDPSSSMKTAWIKAADNAAKVTKDGLNVKSSIYDSPKGTAEAGWEVNNGIYKMEYNDVTGKYRYSDIDGDWTGEWMTSTQMAAGLTSDSSTTAMDRMAMSSLLNQGYNSDAGIDAFSLENFSNTVGEKITDSDWFTTFQNKVLRIARYSGEGAGDRWAEAVQSEADKDVAAALGRVEAPDAPSALGELEGDLLGGLEH